MSNPGHRTQTGRLICMISKVALVLLFPQDLAGHSRSGPSFPWCLKDWQELEGVGEAWEGSALLMQICRSRPTAPSGITFASTGPSGRLHILAGPSKSFFPFLPHQPMRSFLESGFFFGAFPSLPLLVAFFFFFQDLVLGGEDNIAVGLSAFSPSVSPCMSCPARSRSWLYDPA